MTQREINRLGKKWQKLLRLEHWGIDFYLVRRFRMEDSGRAGETSTNIVGMTAAVKICHPDDWPPEEIEMNPVELTIIHELIHVVNAEVDVRAGDSLDHYANERATEQLALSFFNLAGDHVGQNS